MASSVTSDPVSWCCLLWVKLITWLCVVSAEKEQSSDENKDSLAELIKERDQVGEHSTPDIAALLTCVVYPCPL